MFPGAVNDCTRFPLQTIPCCMLSGQTTKAKTLRLHKLDSFQVRATPKRFAALKGVMIVAIKA